MTPDALASRSHRRLFALLFEGGVFGAVAAFSTFMSSPWTIERTASSPDAAHATRKYVAMANAFNVGMGLFVSILAGSFGPILGTGFGTALMTWIYRYSRAQGLDQGNDWWAETGFDGSAPTAPAATVGRRRR